MAIPECAIGRTVAVALDTGVRDSFRPAVGGVGDPYVLTLEGPPHRAVSVGDG